MSQPTSFLEKNRLIIKGFLIGTLILLMLIPAALIGNLVNEREARQAQVVAEVSSKWANAQTVIGPVLIVPYLYSYKGENDKTITVKKMAHFLPEHLHITGTVLPEVRKRSLYQVTLYRSDLKLDGDFAPLPLDNLGIEPGSLLLNEARIVFGIDDARGLEEEVSLHWNDSSQKLEAGMPDNGAIKAGLSAPVTLNPALGNTFSISLKLRGSENLYFTPVGKTTEVALQSPWPHPAFDGKYLPDTTASVSDKGFKAHWKVLAVSRTFPQAWTGIPVDLASASFGVRLIQPADGYAKTERSVKYAILFIALTFIVFFFLEILQKRQVHPLQYLLVGFALCIFYTLLLSISEYTSFNTAYVVAALATVSLIGLYVQNIFQNRKTAFGFSIALGGLYSYIFILIQLEDYALLFGSIGLFLILAVLMYFSRKIDWYGGVRQEENDEPTSNVSD
ncbi:MAG: cell envelope integrity protein CreD [Chitinophagaceae bacterium]